MDYPITVPGVGLSAGKFTNGNPVGSLPASLDPAEWANAVTDEILNVIIQGGLTPAENTNTQLAAAIKNMIRGGDYKDSVRFTTTANIVLTGLGTQAGGDWPAALTAAERILVKNQTAPAENGIYTAAAGAWVRATDADTGAELNSGTIIPVESGTQLADTNWQLTTDGVVTIGTTALTFVNLNPRQSTFLSTNGYRSFPAYPFDPTPLIVQWGSGTIAAAPSGTITFPIAFPAFCLCVVVCDLSSPTTLAYFGVDSFTTSNFLARTSLASGSDSLRFIAIGY